MSKIPVVDVNIGQKEIEEVIKVVKSKFLIEGENTHQFEAKFAKFTGAKHAITVVNGTSALHLALTALGIGPGDEVITTPFTFIASSNAITFNGAIPIFVDIDILTYNIDPEKIREAITDKTKAIMPVHIFGNPSNMKEIMEIANEHNLYVIEDCAQAHDARISGKHLGTFGTLGVFSFYGTKNLVGGEGGAIISNDEGLYERIKSLKNHGRNPKGGYNHYQIGYNYRITDVIAAIMNVQMDRAHEILDRRHRNGDLYRKLLNDQNGLKIQKILPNHSHSDYIFAPVITKKEITPQKVISYLKEKNIASRTIYSILSYQQPCYLNILDWIFAKTVKYPDYSKVSCPNAEYVSTHHFELPMVSTLSDENIYYIVDSLKSFLSE
ncbi:DegT/DnrJ/EryC1/StrS family aminotransferase [Promethearchaeum syntrophicum]|uniref:DegT/DnrJ/EryC1/StrS family aminotransferase n=1 Tax=Promethearchaeum syntrophicum TaxID=2594042 RepID=A0A5B9D9I2_9ARCH|nr:DegT/DnrJ/EryC1/StrS family aminotransferase [Candidatus Prometheoarchaeum syntrophicum]QEE15390.1 putative aspartate aminotransferase 2 [Candidatus Prometheoarchaeum syntrophicum]